MNNLLDRLIVFVDVILICCINDDSLTSENDKKGNENLLFECHKKCSILIIRRKFDLTNKVMKINDKI